MRADRKFVGGICHHARTARQLSKVRLAQAVRIVAEQLERRTLLAGSVVINELHTHPDNKSELVEFIELTNPGDTTVNLTGATFSSGLTYAFPNNTLLAPGKFIVIAENPASLTAKFGAMPAGTQLLGPFSGHLASEGEDIVIKDSAGNKLDEVSYGLGFPWPIVGDSPGYSLELINPTFDNNLGGNWRSFAPSSDTTLLAGGSTWHYRKGTSEASNPITTWRNLAFSEDSSWLSGATPMGYDADLSFPTTLSDMIGNYSSVFLRKTINVTNPGAFSSIRLEALYDDGFNLYVNGVNVLSVNVPGTSLAFNALASTTRESNNYDTFSIPPSKFTAGNNEIAVQFFNINKNTSSDAFFDARLIGSSGGAGPTPGKVNAVFNANAAPAMRQLTVTPAQPAANQPVTITMKATDPDGVGSVNLAYQLVNAGSYIAIEDAAYNNPANWTTVAMHDDGLNGDAVAGDSIYSVLMPASLQVNRRLVRYRITTTDALGAAIRAPFADDGVQNFAYYVYNGVPSYTASAHPGTTGNVTYPTSALNSLAVYQLITKKQDHQDSQYIPGTTRSSGYTGDNYLWSGTLVYDGIVYDGIHYRARGGVHRYHMGKNMWKFDFPTGHDFIAKDAQGNPYPVKWSKLNLGAVIDHGDEGGRGEQGLFETLAFEMFREAGIASEFTQPISFRIVENASEAGSGQYDTDFQGLYLAIEQDNGRFLDAHGLPDGNLYKMENGTGPGNGSLQNQAPGDPGDNADLVAFTTKLADPATTDQWIRENVDLEGFYSHNAIIEMTHDWDVGFGSNYLYYHNPETTKWSILPWDVDHTWYTNYSPGGGNVTPFAAAILSRAAFKLEYRNRVRELRDLLYNSGEIAKLADAYAALVNPGGGSQTMVQADRAMWDYNPILASSFVQANKAGQGLFYQNAVQNGFSADFAGMVARLKQWTTSTQIPYIDGTVLTSTDEAAAPQKRTVSYTGSAGFPVTNLKFSTTAFAAGNTGGSFAAMQWRIADVTTVVAGQQPNLELNAAWDSGALSPFNANITIPSTVVTPGHTYRVRVRLKDNNGRWSHWSDAVNGVTQFTASAGNTLVPDNIRVTELNYNPDGFGTTYTAQDFEYIELKNYGSQTISLLNSYFSAGITFTFGTVSLAPGQVGVIVNNQAAFLSRWPGVNVLGSFSVSGTNFNNGGEPVSLLDSFNQPVAQFTYSDAWYPSTDGNGSSLQVVAPNPKPDLDASTSWIASVAPGGTPGVVDTTAPTVQSAKFVYNASPQSLSFTFSEDVHWNLDRNDLVLMNNSTGGSVPAANIGTPIWDAATRTATFAFPGYAGGLLPGGSYTSSINASGVTDGSSNPLTPGGAINFLYAADSSADDQFYASLDATHTTLRVWRNADPLSAQPTWTAPFASLATFAVDGGAGNDALTLDFINGEMRPAGANGFGYRLGTSNETLHLKGPIAWTFATDPAVETPNLSLILDTNANATFSATSTHLAGLSLDSSAHAVLAGGSPRLLVTRALSIASGLSLDLNDNDLIVDYPSASPLPDLQALINSARAGGAWTGDGITSTAAKNNIPKKNTTLGAMEAVDFKSAHGAAATFDGETIDDTAVLVKYTYLGDADFNGKIDGADYGRIDSTFNQEHSAGNIGGWYNGDFNGDGKVDGADYGVIDSTFNSQGSPIRNSAAPMPPLTIPPTKGTGAGGAGAAGGGKRSL